MVTVLAVVGVGVSVAVGVGAPVPVGVGVLVPVWVAVLGLLVLRMVGDPVAETEWQRFPDVMTEMILHGLLPQSGATNECNFRSEATA